LRRTEIPSPWWLRFPAFAAPVAAGLQKADRCPCSASAVSSAGRASASQSLGTKLSAEPRTRRKAARTLSALNFPVGVPTVRTCRPVGTFWFHCVFLKVDLFQPQQGQDIDLDRLEQGVHRGGLVGAVHGAAKAGQHHVVALWPKADRIGEVAGIGAAAHGEGLLL